jgi:hypothetical protein
LDLYHTYFSKICSHLNTLKSPRQPPERSFSVRFSGKLDGFRNLQNIDCCSTDGIDPVTGGLPVSVTLTRAPFSIRNLFTC